MEEQLQLIKIGVFGGAFDPVHNEHIHLMETVIRHLGLEKLVVLPSGNAPHKHTQTPFADRVAMLRLATAHIPEVVIDLSEADVATPTYSSEMLPRMRAKYGDFVHIIGGDSLIDMPTWHCPQEVMRFPHVVIARDERWRNAVVDAEDGKRCPQADARTSPMGVAKAESAPSADISGEGFSASVTSNKRRSLEEAVDYARKTYHATIAVLPVTLSALSSSDVRAHYRVGRAPSHKDLTEGQKAMDLGAYYPMQNGVCYAVHDYIRSHDLYNEYRDILAEVPDHISPERWAHTQEVALMALALNKQLHLPEDKVITAALLHDCMKGAVHIYSEVPSDARQPNVVHAFNGAAEAKHRYGVADEDVLNAIRYHTTGRAAMSDLERLIYLADYCEATRTFVGAKEVREAALADFDKGFLLAVRQTHAHVQAKGGDICPYGEQCYAYYCDRH